MKKSLLVAATVATLGVGMMAPIAAFADTGSNSNGSTSLADKIASKFHLNKTDVQKVFDEDRTARQAEHEQAAKDQLAAWVKDSTLTQAQADKISVKRAEMKADRDANHDEMKSMSGAERKAAMDAKKAELEKWASDNGIDVKYLMPGRGGEGHMGGPRG